MKPLVISVIAAAFTFAFTTSGALAQYPTKTVRAIVAFTPASATDIIGRAFTEPMGRALGQTIIVENRPGAGGTIAAQAVVSAEPDGHTLLIHSGAHAINPAIYPNLKYDTVKDFVAVAGLGAVPNVMIAPPGRYKSMQELLAAAKAKPGALNYGSAGVGSGTHLNAEKIKMIAGVDIQHVPFKGTPEVVTEVAAGRLEFYMAPLNAVISLIKEGRVQALAISGLKRSSLLPDVPTTIEAGLPDSDFSLWIGIFAPAKTPPEVVVRLNAEAMKALATPEIRDRLAKMCAEGMPMSPKEFDTFVRQEIEVSAKLAKAAKLQIQQ